MGPFSGKIGPIIGSSWNGIPYIKIAPDPGKPKIFSPAQIASQQKFKFTGDFTDSMQQFLEVGFANAAVRKTAKNAAFSYLYHHAVMGEYPSLYIDYSKVMISQGNLRGLHNPTLELPAPDTLLLRWEQSNALPASYNDQVMLVAYCPALQRSQGTIGAAIRRDTECRLRLNPPMIGHAVEIYLGMVSSNRKRLSNSQYLGRHGGGI